jgi:hypothetical protein
VGRIENTQRARTENKKKERNGQLAEDTAEQLGEHIVEAHLVLSDLVHGRFHEQEDGEDFPDVVGEIPVRLPKLFTAPKPATRSRRDTVEPAQWSVPSVPRRRRRPPPKPVKMLVRISQANWGRDGGIPLHPATSMSTR